MRRVRSTTTAQGFGRWCAEVPRAAVWRMAMDDQAKAKIKDDYAELWRGLLLPIADTHKARGLLLGWTRNQVCSKCSGSLGIPNGYERFLLCLVEASLGQLSPSRRLELIDAALELQERIESTQFEERDHGR